MAPFAAVDSRAAPRRSLALAAALMLAGCAHVAAPAADTLALLHDELYPATTEPASRDSVLATSPAMLDYARTRLSTLAAQRDPRKALLDALYKDGDLRLSYDGSSTRNADQAFEARAGNCLSLVLMTAAFARHLGLPVSFQNVQVDNGYTREGDLMLVSGHVNLVLGRTPRHGSTTGSASEDWVVDFLPGAALRGQRSVALAEDTVVAMYFNNRAAESLVEGQPSAGYGWVRLAVKADPGFLPAINTLAVLYMRDGHVQPAEAALRHVLARDAANTSVLANLAQLLQRTERQAEAQALLQRLAQLQPDEPFALFDQGRRAMDRGDYRGASDLFARELRRQPDQSEVLFWAALAAWHLGEQAQAARHLQRAVDTSPTTKSRDRYAGKLARLKALQAQ